MDRKTDSYHIKTHQGKINTKDTLEKDCHSICLAEAGRQSEVA
jgi:hypothetical protein